MNTFIPTSDPSFTQQEHWRVAPDTSIKVPKSPSDQVAKTADGRVMQLFAEEVVENRDKVNSIGFPDQQSDETYDAGYVEAGKISMNADGAITIDKETTAAELRNMKEVLLDRKLSQDPERREVMLAETNGIIEKIDAAIARREDTENAECTYLAPASITDALGKLRMTRNKEALIIAVFQLLDGFNALRANDPDKMVELADELQASDGSLTVYERALIDYVRTHNSFAFSDRVQKELGLAILRDFNGTEVRSYSQPLLAAHNAQVDEDDPRTFAAEVLARNGLRKDAFHRYVDFNLAN